MSILMAGSLATHELEAITRRPVNDHGDRMAVSRLLSQFPDRIERHRRIERETLAILHRRSHALDWIGALLLVNGRVDAPYLRGVFEMRYGPPGSFLEKMTERLRESGRVG